MAIGRRLRSSTGANSTGQHPVGWQPYVQYIVSKGYVVFATNFRGSTGQGKAYADAGRTWGGDRDIKDALFAVDLLAARDLIDPDRMALWGGEHGRLFRDDDLDPAPKDLQSGDRLLWRIGRGPVDPGRIFPRGRIRLDGSDDRGHAADQPEVVL